MKKNIFLICAIIILSPMFTSFIEANYLDKLNVKEHEQLGKFAPLVKREGDTLYLKLKSGHYCTLSDMKNCSGWDTCVLYRFVDYFKDVGFYLVFIGYYEGNEYVMVSDKSGQEYLIPEFPEISPDRRHFAAVSADDSGYNENGVFIGRFEDDRIVFELSYKPFDYPINEYALYEFIEWKDNKTIVLNKYTHADKNFCPKTADMTFPVILKFEKAGWRFEEFLSNDTVKCGPNVIE